MQSDRQSRRITGFFYIDIDTRFYQRTTRPRTPLSIKPLKVPIAGGQKVHRATDRRRDGQGLGKPRVLLIIVHHKPGTSSLDSEQWTVVRIALMSPDPFDRRRSLSALAPDSRQMGRIGLGRRAKVRLCLCYLTRGNWPLRMDSRYRLCTSPTVL
jgi:hypothetical protein